MPNRSLLKLFLILAPSVLGPPILFALGSAWNLYTPGGAALWIWLAVILLIALSWFTLSAMWWYRRMSRQMDILVKKCRDFALDDSPPVYDQHLGLPDLARVGTAIEVMREVLVDHLGLYRGIFDAAPDLIVSLSPAENRILNANPAFCEKVGLKRSELLGRRVEQFVTLDKGWDASLAEETGVFTGQVACPGETVRIEANISLARGSGDHHPRLLGAVLRDVTQTQALHNELTKKTTALEKALEERKGVEELKDQFLTTLSHELKTPLVALKGFLQLVMQNKANKEDTDTEEYLAICWRNLAKLERRINDLLDLARLSHAKEQFTMGPVDLTSLVRAEAENIRPEAHRSGISLDLAQIPLEVVMVKGNTEKLIQLVDNLLLNAVKYNERGGEIQISLTPNVGTVLLTISDSGPGMKQEQLAKIFNRFYRAEMVGTSRIEGLGIGLSLVQEIVLLHGGDIQVTSRFGEGTTFKVVLETFA